VKHLFLFELVPFVQHQFFAHKELIIVLFIGMVTGFLAQMILPGRGFGIISTILIGMAGAWLGNRYLLSRMTFIEDDFFRYMASAITGAMALSILINLIRGGEDKDKTHWRH